jgi:hypothetical protein
MGHQPPAVSNSDDRLLCEVYRPFGGVSAETRGAKVSSCVNSRRWHDEEGPAGAGPVDSLIGCFQSSLSSSS